MNEYIVLTDPVEAELEIKRSIFRTKLVRVETGKKLVTSSPKRDEMAAMPVTTSPPSSSDLIAMPSAAATTASLLEQPECRP